MSVPAHTHFHDPRSLCVLGMGASYPGPAISTETLLRQFDETFHLNIRSKGHALAHKLGIKTRHMARDFSARGEKPRAGCSNPELSAQALFSALAEAELDISAIDYLIGHTTTPHTLLPSNIAHVAEHIDYRGPYAEFRQACTGFINALLFASGLLSLPETRCVAIIGSEVGSVFLDPLRTAQDSGQLVNLVQMGDGAAAIVLGKTDKVTKKSQIIRNFFHGQIGTTRSSGLYLPAGGSSQAMPEHEVLEFIHDFESIRTHGLDLFKAGLACAKSCGIDPQSCDYILPHQANGKMDRILQPLLQPGPRVIVHGNSVGNTGSAAIWLGLHKTRSQMTTGQKLLAIGAEATKYMYGGFEFEA